MTLTGRLNFQLILLFEGRNFFLVITFCGIIIPATPTINDNFYPISTVVYPRHSFPCWNWCYSLLLLTTIFLICVFQQKPKMAHFEAMNFHLMQQVKIKTAQNCGCRSAISRQRQNGVGKSKQCKNKWQNQIQNTFSASTSNHF